MITYRDGIPTTLLSERVGVALSELIRTKENVPTLFLISGGSAFKALEHIDVNVLGSQLTIACVDDRFSRDPQVSNFLSFANSKFYAACIAHGTRFISSVPEEGETFLKAAARFEHMLRDWYTVHGERATTIALMGVGPDCHTAGIMPLPEQPGYFDEQFVSTEQWVVGYDAGVKNQYPLRITVTVPFLQTRVDHAVVYVSGEGKAEALAQLLNGETNLAAYPAQLLHGMREVSLYTDLVRKVNTFESV